MFTSPFRDQIGFYGVQLSKPCKLEILFPLLHTEELELLKKRDDCFSKFTFCMGRIAAHAAMAQIMPGMSEPVLENEQGLAVWPDGIVGSIGCSDKQFIAAVARSEDALSLGVSIKRLRNGKRLSPQKVMRGAEPVSRSEWKSDEGYAQLLCLYSAKESLVNALAPLCNTYINDLDILLNWEREFDTFKGALQRSLSKSLPQGLPLEVGCRASNGYVLTYTHFKSEGNSVSCMH